MRVPPLTQADRIGVSGLGDEQWKKLVHMLQERKPEPNEHLSVSIFLSLGLSIQEPLNIWLEHLDFGRYNRYGSCYE